MQSLGFPVGSALLYPHWTIAGTAGFDALMTQLPNISFTSLDAEPQAATVVYLAAQGEGLPAHLQKLDEISGGAVTKAIKVSAFKKKRKSAIEILAPHGIEAGRLLIAGVGDAKTLNARDWTELGGFVRGKLAPKTLAADVIFSGLRAAGRGRAAQFCAGLRSQELCFQEIQVEDPA